MRRKYENWLWVITLLLIGVAASFMAGLCIGEINLSPREALDLLFAPNESIRTEIVQQLRFPRVLLGLIVGGALSLSGVILQGIFRNPLVEPYTLGISGGASVGVAVAVVFSLPAVLGGYVLPVAGFAGALFTVFLVYVFGIRRGGLNIQTLLLTGVMISFIASSLMMLLMSMTQTENLHGIVFWIMGSLNETNRSLISLVSVITLVLLVVAYFYAPALNALRLGNESARQLGIHTSRCIKMMFLFTSLLAGICVSIAGVIGFVGLIIPQLMRYWVGSDYRILLLSSFLGGGMFLMLSDILARTIIAPNELPIGVITGIVGGVLFIVMMSRGKKERSVEL